MHVTRLMSREMRHRPLSTALLFLAVTAAVACGVSTVVSLEAHEQRTAAIVAARQAELQQTMAALEDDYRKITKGMGFNVLILPRDQHLADFFADDFASRTMPEAYVDKLANAKIVTVRHLLPSLQRKMVWPEQDQSIILVGTRGEVPVAHLDPKKPLMQPVEPGSVVMGYELHRKLALKEGDTVTLMGRVFRASKLHPPRGTKDDITLWIPLADAQAMLDMEGRINGILALECECAWADLPLVQREIEGILPDTQVIEFASQALARAQTRQRAAQAASDVARADIASARALLDERREHASLLIAAVTIAAAVIVAVLSMLNVRSRREEIGILRAIGVSASRLLLLVLGKAAMVGVISAAAGIAVGIMIPLSMKDASAPLSVDPAMVVAALLGAPLLALVAAWLPVLIAVTRDPAEALRDA